MKISSILLTLTIIGLTQCQSLECGENMKNEKHILGIVPSCCISSSFLPVLEGKCIKYVSFRPIFWKF
jgi:hypothetical protein